MEIALSPLEFARRSRRLYPDREAVVDGDQRWTYAEFFDRCDRFSAVLQALGVGKGDRVAYIAPNTHAHLEGYYAVPQIGAVMVPINYRLLPSDFQYLISHSGSCVVCAHADYLDAIDEIRNELPSVTHYVALEGGSDRDGWLDYEQLIAEASPQYARPAIDERDLLTINYTSGTTSRQKGVMITHRNAYLNAVGVLVHAPMTCAERYIWTLPMFHANGWTFVWIVTAVGGTHICVRRVEPARVLETIAQEGGTMLCAAPTILIGIANAPMATRTGVPRNVRVFTAGAPPAAVTIRKVEEELGWELIHVYGLTETSPFITICERRPEHAGLDAEARAIIKARQGVELVTSGEVRVLDEDDHEVPADGASLGEIVVRGNVVMAGYYRDAESSATALRDGWFRSGDAAVVHPDGYIEIRDRLKDVIISGGENISSVEVEGVLLRHPAVQEVAIVGLPDEKWGEAPHAFVVLRSGDNATEEELRTFAREHLAHFKCPKSVRFVAELPKTATGKIQKYVLRGGAAAIARQ
ncbi:MAG: long-chain-fatty-acid--CoA ligase [Gemmatimonadaceae bacterium]